MNEKNINEETRKVYHEQHKRVANDSVAMQRFMNMIDTDYFSLPSDYFKGKSVLDGVVEILQNCQSNSKF